MAAKKIPVAAIEQLQRALDGAPECQVEDVSKVQAIRILIPQIQNMRSKGYGWSAIARLLSEGGIIVSAVTLKSYLTQDKALRKRGRERKGKGRREPEGQRSGAATEPLRSREGGAEGVPHRRVSEGPAEVSKTVPAPASQGVAAATPMRFPKAAAERGVNEPPRRSSFVPKEDSEEI
jgi:hypothetical protein